MKILVDMNLSPSWVEHLQRAGHEATHWSTVGAPNAPDSQLFEWARQSGYVVFTHDLDFGAMLALTQAEAPSVVQIRTEDVAPAAVASRLLALLDRFEAELRSGAIIVADEMRERVRVLPLARR